MIAWVAGDLQTYADLEEITCVTRADPDAEDFQEEFPWEVHLRGDPHALLLSQGEGENLMHALAGLVAR